MLKIYKLLHKKSVQSTSFLPNQRLLFEFEDYDIVFELENSNNGSDEDIYYRKIELLDLKELSKRKIIDCFIGSSELLGRRANISKLSAPKSICIKLKNALEILEKIQPDSFLKYILAQNESYGEMSAGSSNMDPYYLFQIHLKQTAYLDFDYFNQLTNKLHFNYPATNAPIFYWPFYKKYKKIEDSKEISIISTNTKVRRLGYFKLLSDYIDNNKISANHINKKFESYVTPYKDFLNNYKNNKGLIKLTRTGVSAKPYITTSKSLKLLNLLNNVYSTGKSLKVYQVLRDEFNDSSRNIFTLDKLDKLYFLERILREDFLYISLLLEVIMIKKKTNYDEIIRRFHSLLKMRLNEFISSMFFEKDTKAFKKIRKVTDRVNKWEKPEVYLEHILMPRLNWLFDLELLEIDEKLSIKITNSGVKLFENICIWNDINYTRIINPNEFLNVFYIHMFDNIYCDSGEQYKLKDVKQLELDEPILIYLKQSFDYFQTLAPNRVTASLAVLFAKYKLYLVDDLLVGHRYITRLLQRKEQNIFIYKFQKQYNDGYIQLK